MLRPVPLWGGTKCIPEWTNTLSETITFSSFIRVLGSASDISRKKSPAHHWFLINRILMIGLVMQNPSHFYNTAVETETEF